MEPFIGQIQAFGFNFAPRGWALCNGQLLSIASNSALFSLLGTSFGGDGRTTFGLPDLRGRAPIHVGRGPGLSNRSWGERGGQENHTLSLLEMPSHNHVVINDGPTKVPVSTAAGDVDTPEGAVLAANTSIEMYAEEPTQGAYLQVEPGSPAQLGNSGGSQAHNNMQPYLAVYYSIATQGIYPSRS